MIYVDIMTGEKLLPVWVAIFSLSSISKFVNPVGGDGVKRGESLFYLDAWLNRVHENLVQDPSIIYPLLTRTMMSVSGLAIPSQQCI